MLDIILWVIAAALMVIGFAGTIVPMIPGLPAHLCRGLAGRVHRSLRRDQRDDAGDSCQS